MAESNDSLDWDWGKFIKTGIVGVLTEPTTEKAGVAPNPIGTQPTGVNQTGQPVPTVIQTDKTWIYVGGGIALLLIIVLIALALKG